MGGGGGVAKSLQPLVNVVSFYIHVISHLLISCKV